jgi:hypothetical protein
LATRRYQLIVQLYLRGLLTSRPFGFTSRLRDRVLMDAIDAEFDVEARSRAMQVTAALVGGADLTSDSRKVLVRDFSRDSEVLRFIRQMAFDEASDYCYRNSTLALTNAYEIIAQAGLLGEQEE